MGNNITRINPIRARNASSVRHPLDHLDMTTMRSHCSMSSQWSPNGHRRTFSHGAIRHDHPSVYTIQPVKKLTNVYTT